MIVERTADDKPAFFVKSKELLAPASRSRLLEPVSVLVRFDHVANAESE
jgi:hypothetical protein